MPEGENCMPGKLQEVFGITKFPQVLNKVTRSGPTYFKLVFNVSQPSEGTDQLIPQDF